MHSDPGGNDASHLITRLAHANAREDATQNHNWTRNIFPVIGLGAGVRCWDPEEILDGSESVVEPSNPPRRGINYYRILLKRVRPELKAQGNTQLDPHPPTKRGCSNALPPPSTPKHPITTSGGWSLNLSRNTLLGILLVFARSNQGLPNLHLNM